MRDGFVIAFHYDQDVVEHLKRNIPHTHREWREDYKTWWVSVDYEEQLKQMFGNFEALINLQGELW